MIFRIYIKNYIIVVILSQNWNAVRKLVPYFFFQLIDHYSSFLIDINPLVPEFFLFRSFFFRGHSLR